MKSKTDSCPDLETLAAYLDGRLTGRERADVANHIASCDECYFVFREAAQTRVAGASASSTSDDGKVALQPSSATETWWRSPKVLWSAGAGLAAAASLIVAIGTGVVPWRSDESSALRALVLAVGNDRVVEPRLSGGFAYGPVRGVVRGGDSESISPDVRIAAAQVEKELAGKTAPDALDRLGVAYLLVGNISRAVPTLEDAADHPSTSASILSDLSAAYLIRAAHDRQPQDVGKALTAADRAIALDRMLPEARFNRAMALERAGQRDAAIGAWQDYVRLDAVSGWATEARRHLKQLAPERF
jgi:anti-sigma factor RsiW